MKYVAPISVIRSRGMGRVARHAPLGRSERRWRATTTRRRENRRSRCYTGARAAGSPPETMPGDHDWPEMRVRSGPTSAVDGEILHTEGDGSCHGVVKPAPFTRRRVMASSPCGEWVAVEACAPGTVRVFRGVPGDTADGTTAHVPVADRHGRELTLDARPEPRVGETRRKKEAHVLAMEVVPDDPRAETTEGRSEELPGATVFVMTADALRAFPIRPIRPMRPHVSSHRSDATRFERAATSAVALDAFLGADRGRAVGLASNARARVAVAAARVVRLVRKHALVEPSGGADPDPRFGPGYRPTRPDGPVVACAFLDSETARRLDPRVAPQTFLAIGFAKEIRVVRFFDASARADPTGIGIGIPNERAEVARRVLVDAPGPVRSIAAHAGWLFASTERKTALPAFGDGASAREPVNFAFARADARATGEREATSTILGGSEPAALADDPDDPSVPFLRARPDAAADAAAERTRTLRAMVSPFLPAELKPSSPIEPGGAVFRSTENPEAARHRDARATLQAFTFEPVPRLKTTDARVEQTFAIAASLPLSSTTARPEICALRANARRTEIVVALADVGASTDASVAVAAIQAPVFETRAPDARARFEDWRLVPRGTAPLALSRAGAGDGETSRGTRLEAFARAARRDFDDDDDFDDDGVDDDLALLLLTSPREKETAAAGARVFGGRATRQLAPPASLATVRVASRPRPEPVPFRGNGRANARRDDAPSEATEDATPVLPVFGVAARALGDEGNEKRRFPPRGRAEPAAGEKTASDPDRVLDAIRALDRCVRTRFDRVEATLQSQERRLRRVEESLKK